MVEKLNISYSEYDLLVSNLASKIQSNFDPDYICAIPRGGLAIALHLSHSLECKKIIAEPITLIPTLMNPTFTKSKILIVDDVCDSGETLSNIDTIFKAHGAKNYKFATLHIKPRCIIIPDFFVGIVANSNWIVYPWEKITDPNKEYMASISS